MGIMSTRSKLLVAMLAVLGLVWTAQAKDSKPSKKPAEAQTEKVATAKDEAAADAGKSEAPETVSESKAEKSAAAEAAPEPGVPEAEEVVTAATEIPLPDKTPAASGAMRVRPPRDAGWRFPVGISFVSGESEVGDYYEEELGLEGNMVPVGLLFAPYYQFARGFRLGVDLGPVSFIRVESEIESWDVPVALSCGFTFRPEASVSPYLRGGIKYHFFTGDRVEDSAPGIFGAAGLEFFKTDKFFLSLEVGYDGSEITLGETSVQPGQVLVGLQVVFHDLFGKTQPAAPRQVWTGPEADDAKAAVRP